MRKYAGKIGFAIAFFILALALTICAIVSFKQGNIIGGICDIIVALIDYFWTFIYIFQIYECEKDRKMEELYIKK